MTGLKLVYSQERIFRVWGNAVTSKTNVQRFKDHYGVNPVIAAQVWRDLQTTTINRARLRVLKLDNFLETLHFLFWYKREVEREATFDSSRKTIQKWALYYAMKIQALKETKIVLPTSEEFGNDVLVLSVDGTHCLWNEPSHPEFSQDKKALSHKKSCWALL